MKKGFALLETMIVITILATSLLMLYSTFSNMIKNNHKNIYYDNVSNIYKTKFMMEYLKNKGLANYYSNEDIKELTCNDFLNTDCSKIYNAFNISKMYLTKYNLNNYNKDNYPSYFNNYIDSLANSNNYPYRFILEFKVHDEISYASLGVNNE